SSLLTKIKCENEDDLLMQPGEIKKEPESAEVTLDWSSVNFDKFLSDLSHNREVTTSRKTRTLGRRYEQKLTVQNAIDNDEVAPPPPQLSEPESESEAEPPVKFRGKFKSIKDKSSNERIILTYASHSDESCTELIPDEDASDFELELQKEISDSKKKKQSLHKKSQRRRHSSGSDSELKTLVSKKGSPNKTPRLQYRSLKPNKGVRARKNDDTDFSPGSSEDEDDSSTSASDSDGSDSYGSTSSNRNDYRKAHPRRRADSESSDEEEEKESRVRPRRRRGLPLKSKSRRVSDSSDDGEKLSNKRRRIRKGGKCSSDEDDDAYKPPRSSRSKSKKTDSKVKAQKKRKISSSESTSERRSISTRNRTQMKGKSSNRNLKSLSPNKRVIKKEKHEFSSSESDEAKPLRRSKKRNKKSFVKSDSDSDSVNNSNHSQSNKKIKSVTDIKEEPKEEEKDEIYPVVASADEAVTSGLEDEEDSMSLPDSDSILLKLKKVRLAELEREDVLLEKERRLEMSCKIKEKLDSLHEAKFRQSWAKPKFGSGEQFYSGWEEGLLKFKKEFARLPKQLLSSKSLGNICAERNSLIERNETGRDPSGRITRSRSSNHTSRVPSEKLKENLLTSSNALQNFFDKASDGIDSDSGNNVRRFGFDSFPAFGTSRTHTGLTPTPSVAPSMMASEESDSDSLASRRSPASDSAPLARRKSVASQLIKKFKRKYHRVNTAWLNRSRAIVPSDSSPKLLPTPGLVSDKQIDLRNVSTFFRKDTVEAHRDVFGAIFQSNGINIFSTTLLQSRTRKENRQLLDETTIKSVFGDVSLQANAPLIAKKLIPKKKKTKANLSLEVQTEANIGDDSNSLPASTRPNTPSDSGAVGSGGDDSELTTELPGLSSSKGPLLEDSLRNEDGTNAFTIFGAPTLSDIKKKHRKKNKIHKSSGFDYIRKKKKIVPKAIGDDDCILALKKKQPLRRLVLWPEDTKDIAGEVRTWVVNKHLGETVLHKAARTNCHDAIIYCLENPEYDVNVRDNAGYTPLHEACNKGHLAIVQALLAHGALVNAAGHGGIRPLHEAMENGHAELTRLLLSYGADPTLTTYSGQRPSDLTTDSVCLLLMQQHLSDITGMEGAYWDFYGPVRFMDPVEQGFKLFSNVPDYETTISRPLPSLESTSPASTECTRSSSSGGFMFEESAAPLPEVFLHRASRKRFMIMEDVLKFLELRSIKELVIKLGTEGGAHLETRTELLTNLLSHYEWLTISRREFLKRRQPQKLRLVFYSAPLREVMDIGEKLI
ncbi:Ankyrin repeat-containing domain, partial [Trinorchestia longiramus]